MSNKNHRPAEQSAAPTADERALSAITELRDVMKDVRDDLRWLREKIEAANVLGK